jgi:septal ring factor EnvC (AmiA/AmiB activator)
MMKFYNIILQTRSIFILLFISVALTSLFSYSQQLSKEKLQKTKSRLEEEIKYMSKLLEQTRQSKQTSLNKVMLLNKQIEKRQTLINTISGQVDEIQGQMELQRKNISSLSEELKKMKNEYAKMIYYAYKNLNAYNRFHFLC